MRQLTVLVTLIFLTGCCCPKPKFAMRRCKPKTTACAKAPVESLTPGDPCAKACPPPPIKGAPTPQDMSSTAEVYFQTGTAEDQQKAFNLYLQAAQQGDVHAYVRVGEMYLNGEGVTRDTVK